MKNSKNKNVFCSKWHWNTYDYYKICTTEYSRQKYIDTSRFDRRYVGLFKNRFYNMGEM